MRGIGNAALTMFALSASSLKIASGDVSTMQSKQALESGMCCVTSACKRSAHTGMILSDDPPPLQISLMQELSCWTFMRDCGIWGYPCAQLRHAQQCSRCAPYLQQSLPSVTIAHSLRLI